MATMAWRTGEAGGGFVRNHDVAWSDDNGRKLLGQTFMTQLRYGDDGLLGCRRCGINKGPGCSLIRGFAKESLPLLHARPEVQLPRERRARLGMEEPIRIRDLLAGISILMTYTSPRLEGGKERDFTAAGLSFVSGPPSPTVHCFVRSTSMTPSTIACATCTPLGPNSLARLDDSARKANFPVAKDEDVALALTDAVAPVKISVGACSSLGLFSSSGSVACEKLNAPRL